MWSIDEHKNLKKILEYRKEGILNCVICGVYCGNKIQLFTHALEKHGVETEDYKKLRIKHRKKVNRRIHRRIFCTFCSKKCESEEEFKNHLKIFHESSKPFKCSECDAEFFLESGLKKHFSMSHTEKEKKIQCSTCFTTFRFKTELVKHLATDHDMKKHIQCPQCEKLFKLGQHLRQGYKN